MKVFSSRCAHLSKLPINTWKDLRLLTTHLVLMAEVPLAELKVLADCVAVGDEREQ